jgi:hypothetical protein
MYIQNQSFSDEETLQEQLFDFELGTPCPELLQLKQAIDDEVLNDLPYQQYKATITDEEEMLELDDDVRRAKLAEHLMKTYESFLVEKNELFGVKNGVKTLLYSMDLL